MATLETQARVTCEMTLKFDEEEMRALEALVGYGFDNFMYMFYQNLGESYMKPYAAGLSRIFASINAHMPQALADVSNARVALEKAALEKKA